MVINFRLCLSIIHYFLQKMVNDTTLAIVAIAAVLGLLGLVVVETINVQQQAEAKGCENGRAVSRAFNASKGRCFGH
jgi:hypothetical protein